MSNRIRTLREKLGLSLERLASAVGTDRSTVWRYETGRTPLMNDGARKIAVALGLSEPEELLQSFGSLRTKVIGYVGAGEQIIPIDDSDEDVPAPPGFDDGVALRVKGSSMTPAFREGDVLFARIGTFSPDELFGRDCIVQIEDGRRLVKKVLKGSHHGRVRLFSYEDQSISDEVSLVSAAPVHWVYRP